MFSSDMIDRRAMLRDIADETAYLRHEIGKAVLDARVMAAMAKVPRERFLPDINRYRAFANSAVPIGHGQTISQPFIVALMSDFLNVKPDSVILEVGTGSGYQTAVLAELAQQVYSIEIIGALASAADGRLQQLGYDNVIVRHGDGYDGWQEHAPFDGIIVTAAAPYVPPPLVEQLKPAGRLIIPVGNPREAQALNLVEKDDAGIVSCRMLLSAAFVPMTRHQT